MQYFNKNIILLSNWYMRPGLQLDVTTLTVDLTSFLYIGKVYLLEFSCHTSYCCYSQDLINPSNIPIGLFAVETKRTRSS